jgi:hypothetical protein
MVALGDAKHRTAAGGGGSTPAARTRSRRVGAALLLLCATLAVLRDGIDMGLLLAPLLIATGLAAVIGTIAACPTRLRRLLLSRER